MNYENYINSQPINITEDIKISQKCNKEKVFIGENGAKEERRKTKQAKQKQGSSSLYAAGLFLPPLSQTEWNCGEQKKRKTRFGRRCPRFLRLQASLHSIISTSLFFL